MPESKSGSNLRQVNRWQRDAARAEYLRHPDASIADVARATGVAVRTVARAREVLVKEGLLAPGRNATTSGADAAALAVAASQVAGSIETSQVSGSAPSEAVEPLVTPRGSRAGQTIDGDALRKMNDLLDSMADADDETTRKMMLRQVKRFAFDPDLHPDTRMSASQLWAKLLDMQRAKDLGPGIPLTLDAAIKRATDFLRGCGAKVAVPAFYAAFDLGDPNATQAVDTSQSAPAPVVVAGPTNDQPQARSEA